MTPDEMKNLVKKCMIGFSAGDLSALEGSFHDDYTRHVTPGLKGVSSFAEHVEDLRNRHKVLREARFEIHEMIAEGNTRRQIYYDRSSCWGVSGHSPNGQSNSQDFNGLFSYQGWKDCGQLYNSRHVWNDA